MCSGRIHAGILLFLSCYSDVLTRHALAENLEKWRKVTFPLLNIIFESNKYIINVSK